MTDLKIGVTGCGGRMGRMLIREVAATPGCRLAGAVERPGHDEVGQDAGELAGMGRLGVVVGDDAVALFERADVDLYAAKEEKGSGGAVGLEQPA